MAILPQLLSFYSSPEPVFCMRNGSETSESVLEGAMSVRFSAERYCIGYMDEEEWVQCDDRMRGVAQCPKCRSLDISNVFSKLDFSAYPEMEDEYVDQDFSVYLAQFGNDLIKCGVTKSERLPRRTMEQGADFWAEIMRFDDGRQAYEAEMRIQRRFELCNAVRNSTKLALIGKATSPARLESVIKSAKCDKALPIQNLAEALVHENRYYNPIKPVVSLKVDGEIKGSKSKLLFYMKDGKDFVVDMSKNSGRFFKMEKSP